MIIHLAIRVLDAALGALYRRVNRNCGCISCGAFLVTRREQDFALCDLCREDLSGSV